LGDGAMKKRNKVIYVIISKYIDGTWKIESDVIGRFGDPILIPKTRFTKKEAKRYCAFRNKLEGKKIFDYIEVNVHK